MMAALICVISLAVFAQFFVWYCRSILAPSCQVKLSQRVREVTGITNQDVAPEDFHRLLQLVRLCPERGDDRSEIRAVGAYYRILAILKHISVLAGPRVAQWADHERRDCSYFAAVALDRRISYSRDLFTQQISDRL